MRSREAVSSIVKAYDIRGVVGKDIDSDFVRDVGAGFAALVRDEGETTVVIGHDMRPSSPGLSRAFAEGVAAQGLDVVELGLSSTDELYFASGSLGHAGAMFTASHNPAEYNGVKLCRAGARPVGQETGLATIAEHLVADDLPDSAGRRGAIERRDVLADYGEFLRGLVDLSALGGGKRLVVAVDAANGMAGLTVPEVLGPLPLDIRPLYFELDGTFPHHPANPLDPKNLVDLQQFVVEEKADIGLAFDGDADRCFVVDERGEAVSPSAICALIAERYLKDRPGATIIHNLITSKTVPEIIREHGGRAVRTRVGHSFIKATMAEEHAVFGGEHSAHYYFSEFFNADSGLLAALHVLGALAEDQRPLSELKRDYSRYSASGEINSRVADQAAATESVVEAFRDRGDIDRLDGVTVNLPDGSWFNLRASNTEPLLRLNVEAPTQDAVSALVEDVLGIIRS